MNEYTFEYLPHLLWAQSTRLEAKMISFLLKWNRKKKKTNINLFPKIIIIYDYVILSMQKLKLC